MNMREEPVLYINSRPFVLRNMDKPFNNVEYTGISIDRIEQLERRLKDDVLKEAAQHNNKILLHDETPAGVETVWEDIQPDTVLTINEVYEKLNCDEGYDVQYFRVPITDEKVPELQDFDEIVARVKAKDSANVQLVFNCQMGRGRTTTSMIVGCLLCTWLMWDQLYVPLKDDSAEDYLSEEDTLLQGHYHLVNDIRRLLQCGPASKRQLDAVIDLCSPVQNLRTAIYPYLEMYRNPPKESKRDFAAERFTNYLERYFFLILFAEYVNREAANVFNTTFTQWMQSHPEFMSVHERKLHLEKMRPWLPGLQEEIEGSVRHSGAVLTPRSFLKDDKIVAQKGSSQAHTLAFRRADGFPVFGMCQPSISDIRTLLEDIGAKLGAGGKSVLWINLREEPVVYINGHSYVLRAADQPYRNITFKGISSARVETLSKRLRSDVIREAIAYGGKILVYHEVNGQLVPQWESVGVGGVQSLEEVFETLAADGYRVSHRFIPITSTEPPTPDAVTALFNAIETAPRSTQFFFNCMRGRGRTTMAMMMTLQMLHATRKIPLQGELSFFLHGVAAQSKAVLAIRNLLRILKDGSEVKKVTDRALALCSPDFVTKLKKEIQAAAELNRQASLTERDKKNLRRGAGRLRQYLMLLAVGEYVLENSAEGRLSTSFQYHWSLRPELTHIIEQVPAAWEHVE